MHESGPGAFDGVSGRTSAAKITPCLLDVCEQRVFLMGRRGRLLRPACRVSPEHAAPLELKKVLKNHVGSIL